MQDIDLLEGGRTFDGGGGERRLRPHNHQALKCPRCDSLNTKFCYYNNYNLSQPRYFCKGCRRYWTKGGILRKVPVGSGCRKAKRSKTKPSAAISVVSSPPHPEQQHKHRDQCKAEVTTNNNNNNNSSSGGTSEAVSAVTSHSMLYGNSNDLRFEHGSDGGNFSEIGSLMSLVSSSNKETLFDFGTVLNRPEQQQQGLFDETQRIEQSNLKSGFQPLDWEGIGDEGLLFGSWNGVDRTFWNQNQWTYQDYSTLYPQ